MNQLIFKTKNASGITFRSSFGSAFRSSLRSFTLAAMVISFSLTSFADKPSPSSNEDHSQEDRSKEDRSRANRTGSATTAEVSYIGSQEGEPLFNVVYNNTTGSRFSLEVLDGDGAQIFQSSYNDKAFDKKFRVADASPISKLTFIIRNFRDNSVQYFEVNSNTRMVEDVEVKEVTTGKEGN